MISEQTVRQLAEERIEGTDLFIVGISISSSNKIVVRIDGMNGVSIDDCVSVSRNIEHNLDRETEDFELEVTTAGLGKPFEVPQQWQKNVGKEVKIKMIEGGKKEGTFNKNEEDYIVLETTRKERVEGKKKKVKVTEQEKIKKDQIQEIKIVISF